MNWRNPQMRQAMADVLRFWMRRGMDGLRVDAAAVLAVDTLLREDPPNPDFREGATPPPERFERVHTDDRPVTLEYLAELQQVIEATPLPCPPAAGPAASENSTLRLAKEPHRIFRVPSWLVRRELGPKEILAPDGRPSRMSRKEQV